MYFNPRTPVGCDRRRRRSTRRRWYFNPRTPVGCDRPVSTFTARRRDFNPRTPVGCDNHHRTPYPTSANFNPRTPVGCDQSDGLGDLHKSISIHAPQWGATSISETIASAYQFQSTHPSGVRPSRRTAWRAADRISIHAPQWGATPNVSPSFSRSAFQSTHPSGVRLLIGELAKILKQFQSTHPSGVRPCPVTHVVPTTIFQSCLLYTSPSPRD